MVKPRKSTNSKRSVRSRELLRLVKGWKYTPAADPPTVVMNPWFKMVLTVDLQFPITPAQSGVNAGNYRIHGADVRSQLGTQLGINLSDTNLLLRIEAISIWKLTSGPIGLTPTDPFSPDDSNALAQIEDSPAKNSWARCGYRYPEYIRDRPWFVKSDSVSHCATIIVASSTDKAQVLYHLYLMFKFDTANWPEFRRYPGSPPGDT